jgi:hypothetical protein
MDRGPADDRGRSAALRRRLLGRDAEIAAIERSFDDARAGRGAGINESTGVRGVGAALRGRDDVMGSRHDHP